MLLATLIWGLGFRLPALCPPASQDQDSSLSFGAGRDLGLAAAGLSSLLEELTRERQSNVLKFSRGFHFLGRLQSSCQAFLCWLVAPHAVSLLVMSNSSTPRLLPPSRSSLSYMFLLLAMSARRSCRNLPFSPTHPTHPPTHLSIWDVPKIRVP